MHSVSIGTRPSTLALRQTDLVVDALRAAWPGLEVTVYIYATRGDRESERPLPEIGGKGLFTAEIEAGLQTGEIQLAVHSLKDLPIPDCVAVGAGRTAVTLCIGAVLPRGDAGDVLISRHGLPLAELPPRPRIGTCSPRRAAQILAARPDAQIVALRGNVETRLRKAAGADYDAIVLAAAGLERLNLLDRVTERLTWQVMLPAPGQGALAAQCRADDAATLALLRPLHHVPTWAAVTAERAFLQALGGGCVAPVAAYACPTTDDRRPTTDDERWPTLHLRGAIGSPLALACDDEPGATAPAPARPPLVRVAGSGPADDPVGLGQRLAAAALDRGGRALLAGLR